MMYGYDGYGVVAGLMMLLFWFLLIGGTVLVVRYFTRSNSKTTSALELLDERLARGDISVSEYHERKAALQKR